MSLDLGMPILLVDDFPTMLRIVRGLLVRIGFRDIDEAGGGAAALARLRGRACGLVLCDWHMEPMTGYELLRRVRADRGLRETPFVMVTAEAGAGHAAAARQAGVNGYLVKPFDAATLRARIEAVCGA